MTIDARFKDQAKNNFVVILILIKKQSESNKVATTSDGIAVLLLQFE